MSKPERESVIVEDEALVQVPPEVREYVQDEIGDALRGIAHYDQNSVSFELFVDDADYTDDELQNIVRDLRIQDLEQEGQEGLYRVGNLYCTLRAFDDALILHFIQDEQQGTVVSVEPTAIDQLSTFMQDILALLDEHSSQDIAHTPQWTDD